MKLSRVILILSMSFTASLNAQTITNYTTVDGLASNNVKCVAIDGSGNAWFGTQAGVSKFDGTTWTTHNVSTDTGLVNDDITAIHVDNANNVWVGTSFGASKYNGTNWVKYTTADGLGSDQINYINQDLSGNIWFATNLGASKFNGTSTWTNFTTADGLPFGGVKSITIHPGGDIWMGTGLGGVKIYNGSTFSTINSSNGLLIDKVRGIAINSSGEKWVATANGISVFNSSNTLVKNHTRMYVLPPPDTLNPVEDVRIDSRGYVWSSVWVDYLVTEGAVCMWAGLSWKSYDVSKGLVGPAVRRMAIDSNDDVWVTTSSGVSKISNVPIAIDNELAENEFMVYPNPASDILNVRFSVPVRSQTETLEVYNMTSQLVYSAIVQQSVSTFQIPVADLDRGMYFVKAGTQVVKVVVQ